MRGIVDDLVNDFLDVYFPEAIPMVEKEAYLYEIYLNSLNTLPSFVFYKQIQLVSAYIDY